ncbi:MAG: DUF4403 family protein [Lewinellaceae bacterium]|nr:DUF4403 family protein [Saprospiraceae bacterium]MCB9307439.1 DUF4403 family protein [Lewinellaceae bacterium]MCB9355887.1 DUF4403 family protein [Lewinellaceae bacterium]
MKAFFALALLTSMFLFPFCKTGQYASAPKPPENYNPANEPALLSSIAVPVNISIKELLNSLNTRLSGQALYEDYSYSDNGNDGLMLNVWKSQDITMFVSGNTIKYRLPLKLWMKKNLLVADAEADAELALNMKTTFYINPDWSLSTHTEVEYHEWLAKPRLKTGLGNISIETLANLALNRSKSTLSQTLDRYVSQQLNLRPYVEEVWTALQEPILLDSAYNMWVKTTPVSIGMTPIVSGWENIRATIAVECLNDVTFGAKPWFRQNSTLPGLQHISEAPDEFQIRVATDVPFPEAERMAKNMMIGQVFESGKKKVKVEDIQLWGNNDRLVVNTKLSGSFNGNIYFIGRPQFNPDRNQIEVRDLDFHVDTRSFLLRSAAWLFQGTIKNQMKNAMTFPLENNISELKTSVQQSLDHYELQPGVVLSGVVDSITVENTRITPTSIRVNLFSKGRLNLDVRGL